MGEFCERIELRDLEIELHLSDQPEWQGVVRARPNVAPSEYEREPSANAGDRLVIRLAQT